MQTLVRPGRRSRPARTDSPAAAVAGRGRRRGQSLVEFAIILPVFMFLVVIAIDFGRAFFSYIEVTNAAREGAAYAATQPTDEAGITDRASKETNSQVQGGENAFVVTVSCTSAGGASIDCDDAPGGGGTGNIVTVSVDEPFSFLTPIIGSFFGNDFHLRASASSAVLNLAAGGGGTPGSCTTLPNASFIVSVSDLAVTLDANGSTPKDGLCAISSYLWDMGDGADPFPPVTGANATYTYSSSGTFPVTLTVANLAGEVTSTQFVNVGVTPTSTPTATPNPTPTSTPAPTPTGPVCNFVPTFTAQFTGQGNGSRAHEMTFQGAYTGQPAPTSWSWDFGAGTGTGQTVSKRYGSAGTYTVTLTIVNGSCSANTSKLVVVP